MFHDPALLIEIHRSDLPKIIVKGIKGELKNGIPKDDS
jgi:hypothetical protein